MHAEAAFMNGWRCHVPGIVILGLLGCGGADGEACSVVPDELSDEPVVEACGGAAFGSTEQLERTPLPDRTAELIALDHTRGIVAHPALYERVAAELDTLRSLTGRRFVYYAHNGANAVSLDVQEQAFAQMEAGTYEPWRCLNDHYGVESVNLAELRGGYLRAELFLGGFFHADALGSGYAPLPGVYSTGAAVWDEPSEGGLEVCFAADAGDHLYLTRELGCGGMYPCRRCDNTLYRADACGNVVRVRSFITHAELGCTNGLTSGGYCRDAEEFVR